MNKPFVNLKETDDLLNNDVRALEPSLFFQIENLLAIEEVERLERFIAQEDSIPVGLDGIKENYQQGDEIGSYRLSIYNEAMAEKLWDRVKQSAQCLEDDEWTPIGINPLFRFIVYKKGGSLVPHYDAPYIQDDNIMTRRSMVIYLTDNTEGKTEFIEDDTLGQENRSYEDRPNYQGRVIASFTPKKGTSLIFKHRLLHQVMPLEREAKTIIRTDIVYKRKQ